MRLFLSDATHCARAGDKLQLDLHLFNMVTESRQALAADPTRLQLKFIHAANLLDSVYFLWFDQQQLTRGAKHLAEVGLLPNLPKCEQPLHDTLC